MASPLPAAEADATANVVADTLWGADPAPPMLVAPTPTPTPAPVTCLLACFLLDHNRCPPGYVSKNSDA
jgi:hypothetical protein